MRQRLTPLLQTATDLDYVERFQVLAATNMEIQRNGTTAPRLVRKAVLELDVGNFLGARDAAAHAVDLDDGLAEAHFVLAKSYVLLALVKAGGLPQGPGEHAMPGETVTGLLEAALIAFTSVLRLQPQDEEAREDKELVANLLEAAPSEASLVRALREAIDVA